jgi:hypothetical protein
VAVPFYSLAARLSGTGKGYTIGVEAEGFLPAKTVSTIAGDLAYSYAARGAVHIDFGKTFRFGIQSGIETHQYKVSTDTYFRSDFFAGISIGYGGGPTQSSASGYDSKGTPSYPIL